MIIDLLKKIYIYFFGVNGYTKKELRDIKKLIESNRDYVLHDGRKYFQYEYAIGLTYSFLVSYGDSTVKLLGKNGDTICTFTIPVEDKKGKSTIVTRVLPLDSKYCDFYYKVTRKDFIENMCYKFVNVLVSQNESIMSESHRYEDVLATGKPVTEYMMGKFVKLHNEKLHSIEKISSVNYPHGKTTKRIPKEYINSNHNTDSTSDYCDEPIKINTPSSDNYSGGGGNFGGGGSGSSWSDSSSSSSSSD